MFRWKSQGPSGEAVGVMNLKVEAPVAQGLHHLHQLQALRTPTLSRGASASGFTFSSKVATSSTAALARSHCQALNRRSDVVAEVKFTRQHRIPE